MGVVTATIMKNGDQEMPGEYELMNMDIIKAVDKIPHAQIILLDGNPSKYEFEISDTDFFDPGSEFEIKLRDEEEPQNEATVFKGVVVKHSVKASTKGSFLTIELKNEALRLTTCRKSAVYQDKSDSEIIKEIVQTQNQISVDTVATRVQHKEMVQYNCTDWDFIHLRAEANGLLIFTDDEGITLKKALPSGEIKRTLEYGKDDIYDFEIETDIQHQYKEIRTQSWNIESQDLLNSQYTTRKISQGKSKSDITQLPTNLGRDTCTLTSAVDLPESELKAWAVAKGRKSRRSLIRGRMKVPGNAALKLSDLIKITNIGARFDGRTIITGVRHQVGVNGWQTEIQFGFSPEPYARKADIMETPAAGLLPAISGLQVGVVNNIADPDHNYKVQVKIPALQNEDVDSFVWARMASIDARAGSGAYFCPKPGDEVILGFFNDDPRQPVILGSMYSKENEPHEDLLEDTRGFTTQSGLKVLLYDNGNSEKSWIQIMSAKDNYILLNDQKEEIILQDQHHNMLLMNSKGITIKGKAIKIEATGGDIDIDASGELNQKAEGINNN